MEEHGKCTVRDRKERLSEALFLRTWCLNDGKGGPITTPPSTKYARMSHIWWGKIPMEAVSSHILIRDVGLDATWKLGPDATTYLTIVVVKNLPLLFVGRSRKNFW